MEDWADAATGFARYFELEHQLCKQSSSSAWVEPALGSAYGRFHAACALYQLGDFAGAIEHLEGYFKAVEQFKERKLFTVDGWGNEVYTELDKEMQRQRQWMVCGRCRYSVCRMLASLFEQHAAQNGGKLSRERLRGAIEQLNIALGLATNQDERQETSAELLRMERLQSRDMGSS